MKKRLTTDLTRVDVNKILTRMISKKIISHLKILKKNVKNR
ncbi:hypothetical protein ACQUNI_001508 [Enterococcus hirae]